MFNSHVICMFGNCLSKLCLILPKDNPESLAAFRSTSTTIILLLYRLVSLTHDQLTTAPLPCNIMIYVSFSPVLLALSGLQPFRINTQPVMNH
jgi:hypothetical protein